MVQGLAMLGSLPISVMACPKQSLFYDELRYRVWMSAAGTHAQKLQVLQPKYFHVVVPYLNHYPANVENRVNS
jgi:hypothetical protein